MSNQHRIVIIVSIFILIIAAFFIMVRPALNQNLDISQKIGDQKETNSQLKERVLQLAGTKDDFNMRYAQYQKYSVRLPGRTNIQFLANEIYEIGQFADVEIQSINFNETASEDGKIGIIDINLILTSPYYNILIFISTFESMPRITKLESINLSYSADGYPNMTATMIGKTYYQIED